jgi:archaetidylinositol phosphate synthase
MLSNKKPVIEKFLKPLLKYLLKVNPNVLTLIGSIPPIVFFVFVVSGNLTGALIAFPFLIVDLLDGMVARLKGQVTAFGGFLDSTIDRISDFLLISAFGFGHIVRFEIVLLFVFATFLVSYTRSRGELASQNKVSFGVGILERTERLIGIFAGLVIYMIVPDFRFGGFNFLEIIFISLFLLSVYTFFQRVFWAYKKL